MAGKISNKFSLLSCDICNLKFKNTKGTENNLHEAYVQSSRSNSHVNLGNKIFRRYDMFENTARQYGVGNKVLDIGCGSGEMPYTWIDTWEKLGTELSKSGKASATQLGIKIIDKDQYRCFKTKVWEYHYDRSYRTH